MPDDARRGAARAIDRTLASGSPLDAAVAAAARRLSGPDLGLCRELAFGTVRWLRRLDWVIERASGRRFVRIDRRLTTPLRMGAYQLLFLDRVPAYAAVNEAVSEARRRAGARAAGFVNGVLRRISERPRLADWPVEATDPAARLAIETSHPEFLIRRWVERWGGESARALAEANNSQRPLQLLAASDRGGREALSTALAAEEVETEPARLSPLALTVRRGDPLATRAFERGDFYVQDQASQAAAWLPLPRRGERILDAHSAPGGKSFALLAREPSVRLAAADGSLGRLDRLRANRARLGRRLPLFVADGAAPAVAETSFDRVLLDLPCSGTGTIRQHPELKWRVTEREIQRLAAQGRRLVEAASPLVRRGGQLVIVTCTLEPEENEEMVDAFLADFRGYRLRDLASDLEGAEAPALAAGLFAGGRWRLPTTRDHDGFTVQVLDRIA